MYSTKPSNTTQKTVAGIVLIVAVVLLFIMSNVSKSQQKSQTSIVTMPATSADQNAVTVTTTVPTPMTHTNAAASSSGYKDGVYKETIQYYVPHGQESIKVTLTLKNAVVTDSSLDNSENDGESAQYQEAFNSDYKSAVVGKKISDVNLSYIAGASDTTQAFDDAVTKIMNDAKS